MIQWKLGCRSRKQKRKTQPIARHGIEHCHWFILPLLLATPTMQFSLDRKRRSHKQNQCSASDSVGLIFTRSYRFTLLITTPTTTPSLVKTSLNQLRDFSTSGWPFAWRFCWLEVSTGTLFNTVTIYRWPLNNRDCGLTYNTCQKLNKKARWCFVRHLCLCTDNESVWIVEPSTFAISFNKNEIPIDGRLRRDRTTVEVHSPLRSLRWQEFHFRHQWLPTFSLFANALFSTANKPTVYFGASTTERPGIYLNQSDPWNFLMRMRAWKECNTNILATLLSKTKMSMKFVGSIYSCK